MEEEKQYMIIVDDRPENLLALEGLLERPGLDIIKAASGEEALGLMLEYDFALAMMDVQMPDMDGFETAELMRGSQRTRHIPIIFVTAISKDQKHVFKGYEAGAVDYIFKPLDPHIIQSKVTTLLELNKHKRNLEKTNDKLQNTVDELEKANKKILKQQKSVIEEERLNILLQISGATAHELNQPLMTLMGGIQLMEMFLGDPEKLTEHMAKVNVAGNRISRIVQKMQTIRKDETISYAGGQAIINFDQVLKILIVEDSDADYKKVKDIFEKQGRINLERVKSFGKGINSLEETRFDLVFMGYNHSDGEALKFLKKTAQKLPVVVILRKDDEMAASRVIQAGAADYLPKKLLNDSSLSHMITNSLEKSRLMKESKKIHDKLTEMSIKDDLTGLYNRRYFMDIAGREIAGARRYKTKLAMCLIDIDHFKDVNDTYSHSAGDAVLTDMGRLLKETMRESDLICRYGGEEFAVILLHAQEEAALRVCRRFREKVSKHQFMYNSDTVKITIGIGIALFNISESMTHHILIANAEKALYSAKQRGDSHVEIFSGSIDNSTKIT